MRRRPSGLVLAALLALALLVGALVVVGLVLAFREGPDESGPSRNASTSAASNASPTSTSSAGVTAPEVAAFVRHALPALSAGDREAWRRALPSTGSGARATAALYSHLAPLRIARPTVVVTAPPGLPGAFDIIFGGQVAGEGPPDRFLAERVLVVRRLGGRLVVTDDESPSQLTRQEFMAFNDPRVLSRDNTVVVYDAGWELRAAQLAALMPAARQRVAQVVGAWSPRPATILMFSSSSEVADYLGNPTGFEERIVFQAYPVVRLASERWYPDDIILVAPQLSGLGAALATVLTHEVTHVLTASWFAHAPNRSSLLNEGLAVTVAQDRSYDLLKHALAAGDAPPLLQAIAYTDLWGGHTAQEIEILYEEGGSVVSYILQRWGGVSLRQFLVDLGTTNLTDTPIRLAVRRHFGVRWDEFVAGWRAYVQTLP